MKKNILLSLSSERGAFKVFTIWSVRSSFEMLKITERKYIFKWVLKIEKEWKAEQVRKTKSWI